MNSNQEEDEFVAVRVQDPRVQNEGSWNSYVDYKIFLHTNSKAFTAKTSCVRRRYSEFAWLRKKLQKNAGLVPVPELPGKSFFSFSNEDFLEGRRKGLQTFLDKVVHTTVCLSDSQLHLFLQTQLPVGHIEDCVQGHTPYSVTDAILTYASSNWGLAQAQEQEDDSIKEPSLTVSYESMESPAPHQPCLQTKETFSPELLSCGDADALELRDKDAAPMRHTERPSAVRISQNGGHLEAVVECDCGPAEAAFFLGDGRDHPESPGLAEQRGCRMRTPVEVHSPMGTCFEERAEKQEEEKSVAASETEAEARAEQPDGSGEAETSTSLDFKDKDAEGRVTGSDTGSREEVLEVVCPEEQLLENHVSDVGCPEESDGRKEADDGGSSESGNGEETTLESETHAGAGDAARVPELASGADAARQLDQERADPKASTGDESDEDSRSLPSSNESIVKVSDDEESACDEAADALQAANGFVKTSESVLGLRLNGRPAEREDEDEDEDEDDDDDDDDLRYMTSLDLGSTVAGGDLTGSGDFSVLETSCAPDAAESKRAEQETLSPPALDAPEVQVR